MVVTVDNLLTNRFANRSTDEKMKIIMDGRPRPHLPAVVETIKLNNKVPSNKVLAALYSDHHWLTGCEIRQRLFCWSCLLFTDELTPWNTVGYCDMKHVQENIIKHKNTMAHIQSVFNLQMFLHENVQTIDTKSVIQQHNQLVKRNRELIKRLIDVVYNMLQTQTPSRRDSQNHLEIGECVKALMLLKNYDTPSIIDDAIDLLQISPKAMTDMVEAMNQLVKLMIKRETQLSTYVSVILSEHADISSSKSQISTVLRYLKAGKVCERFIGFTAMNEYKSADVIYRHIQNVIAEFKIRERFLAFACDGAVLPSTKHLTTLISNIQKEYPYSFFAPCYFHRLHFILLQSLSRIAECHHFFKTMNSIKSFFQSNRRFWYRVFATSNCGVPDLCEDDWCNPEFLRVVKRRRRHFIEFFEWIVDNCDEWNADEVAKALGYQRILQEFQTVYLLEVFYKLFGYTSCLDKVLNSNIPENVFGSDLSENVETHLALERENGFEKLWVFVVAECLGKEETKPGCLKTALKDENKFMYRELFFKIIDEIIQEIDARFQPVRKLEFFHILNYEKYGKLVISGDHITKLLNVHGPYFEETSIKHELQVLCTNQAIFGGKTIYEILDIFCKSNLKSAFEHLYKLAELILTVPCKAPSRTDNPSKLDSIAQWSYIPEASETPGEASVLFVESDVLEELGKRTFFHDEVMIKFCELNRSIDVIYK